MPLLSMTTTSRARFSSAVLSLYSLFLSLSLSHHPCTSFLFSFSLCRYLSRLLRRQPRSPLSPQPSAYSLSRHLSVAPVPRRPFVLARTPFRGTASLSSPVISYRPLHPLHLLGRSLRHETRLPSERNQSPCTKRCATPRAMCKLKSAWRYTRFSHFRPPRCVARARVRRAELRNPGIYAGVRST